MDQMSLFSILTVSVPEAILNIYIGFVLIGHRTKLYLDDKLNIIRLISAVPLMVIVAVINRSLVSNLVLVLLINVVAYTLIIKLVYKLKWFESLLCVVIFVGILITIEFAYMYQFLVLMDMSIEDYLKSDIMRFIISLPQRAIQVAIIISFWNWDLVYLSIQSYKKVKSLVISFTLLLFLTEAAFYTLFMYSLEMLSTTYKIYYSICCFMFVVINFLFSKLLTTLLKKIK